MTEQELEELADQIGALRARVTQIAGTTTDPKADVPLHATAFTLRVAVDMIRDVIDRCF